jgi:hypothetical protein
MEDLTTTSTEAVGAPQDGAGAGRVPIFTRPGRYRILLGDNLGTQYQSIQAQCAVEYVDGPAPR